jgi:hypothetical protein
MHRMTRLSTGTLLAATALALPAILHAGTTPRTAGAARTVATDARTSQLVRDVSTEGAAEHASQRIMAIISNVGREGAAEHQAARSISRNRTPS